MKRLKIFSLSALLFGAVLLTGCDEEEPAILPEVTTVEVTSITTSGAVSGGNVANDGGADVIARGVCWDTSSSPTVSGSKTENGSGTGSFSSEMAGLTADTKYYVRAYATNSAGTAYGQEVSFTTEKLAAFQVDDPDALEQTVFADETLTGNALSFTTTGPWTSTITEVTTKSGTKAATKSETVSWISITPDHGDVAGKYDISINLEPNLTGEDRSATITVTCAGEEMNITITQKGIVESGEQLGKKISFRVNACNEQWSPYNGNPAYYLMDSVMVKVYKDGEQVAMAMSNAEGIAELSLATGDYTFTAESTQGWKNIYNNYVISGIFISQVPDQSQTVLINGISFECYPGEIRWRDLNDDGMIDDQDKVDGVPLSVTEGKTVDVYVASTSFVPLNAMYISRFTNMYSRFCQAISNSYRLDAALTQEYISGMTIYSKFTFDTSNGLGSNLWEAAYYMVKYANNILTYIYPFYGGTRSEADLSMEIAVARYYRAYAYSILLNYFGGVPLVGDDVDTYNYVPILEGGRLTVQEIENYIIADCDFAIEHLASSSNGYGDVNRLEAQQLKARVLINSGKYQEAYQILQGIIDSGRYQLGMMWGMDAMSTRLITTGLPYEMLKGDGVYPIRYTETLLLYVEAALAIGNTASALAINQFAYVEGQNSYLPQGASLEEIRKVFTHQRNTRLNMEGHTFAYLKRSGLFLNTLQQYGASQKHLWLPIPQSVLETNASLLQNYGW